MQVCEAVGLRGHAYDPDEARVGLTDSGGGSGTDERSDVDRPSITTSSSYPSRRLLLACARPRSTYSSPDCLTVLAPMQVELASQMSHIRQAGHPVTVQQL